METVCPHAVISTTQTENGLRAGRLQKFHPPFTDHSGASRQRLNLLPLLRTELEFLRGNVLLEMRKRQGRANQRAGGVFEGFALARFSKLKRSLSVERTSVASFVSTLR